MLPCLLFERSIKSTTFGIISVKQLNRTTDKMPFHWGEEHRENQTKIHQIKSSTS